MRSLTEVYPIDFKEAVTVPRVRSAQIVFAAMAFGMISFCGVVVFLFVNGAVAEPRRDAEGMLATIMLLTGFNIVAAVVIPFIGKFVADRQFSSSNLIAAVEREFTDEKGRPLMATPAEKCMILIRTAWIIRLATLDASAMFGLTVSLVAVTTGVAGIEPLYMANMLSIVPLLAYVVVSFPTPERFNETFESRIRNQV